MTPFTVPKEPATAEVKQVATGDDFKIGDRVVITNNDVFANGCKVGDTAKIVAIWAGNLNFDLIFDDGSRQTASPTHFKHVDKPFEPPVTPLVPDRTPNGYIDDAGRILGRKYRLNRDWYDFPAGTILECVQANTNPTTKKLCFKFPTTSTHLHQADLNEERRYQYFDNVDLRPGGKLTLLPNEYTNIEPPKRIRIGLPVQYISAEGQTVYGKITDYDNYKVYLEYEDGHQAQAPRRNWQVFVTLAPPDLYATRKPFEPPKGPEVPPKLSEIGMKTVRHSGKWYFIMPMKFAPKYIKKDDGYLYHIPRQYQEQLADDCMFVGKVGHDPYNHSIGTATMDLKYSFTHFHSHGKGAFESFCLGTMRDVEINTAEQALDAKERLERMLEVIGYEDPPVPVVKGISTRNIARDSFVPVIHKGFTTNQTGRRHYYIHTVETLKEQLEEKQQQRKNLMDQLARFDTELAKFKEVIEEALKQ